MEYVRVRYKVSTTQHYIALHSSGHEMMGDTVFFSNPHNTYIRILLHTFNTTTISKLTLLQ